MIVNMNVSGGSQSATHAEVQPHGQVHSHVQAQGHVQSGDGGVNQCDFNFLKRKYETQVVELPLAGQDYDANPWKKRHLDYDVNGGDMCFQLQLDTATNSHTNSSSTNSSAFINDLFAYDSSLLVPAASYCAPPTVETVEGGWQTGELLELDHRYNSGLQTEINQLNATLPPPPPPPPPPPSSASSAAAGVAAAANSSSASSSNFLLPIAQKTQQSQSQSQGQNQTQTRRRNSETEPDFEDKNLSWLLNFKFDEFPHLSPDVGGGQRLALEAATPTGAANMASNMSDCSSASNSNHSHHSVNSSHSCNNTTTTVAATTTTALPTTATTTAAATTTTTAQTTTATANQTQTKTGRKFEELVMEVTSEMDANDMIVAEHVVVEDTTATSKAPKKPPFTYTELIEYALEDKGELTVSGIYQWISDRFPYYKSNDDRWKNSVRHNLSINPHFRKGVKAPQGAGHLWAISSGDSAENVLAWEHKKQRLDLFFKMESINRERIQQHQQQMQQQQQQQQQLQQQQQQHCNSPQHQQQNCQQQQQQQQSSCIYDEAAAAAAALTQEMLQQAAATETSPAATHHNHQQHHNHNHQHHNHNHNHNQHHQHQQQQQQQHQQRLLPFSDLLSDEELRKTAGQILNGIHREVEVQSVNSIISTYQDVLLDNEDYLNPIHKDVVVTESGLRQQQQQQQQQHQQQQQQQQHQPGSGSLGGSLSHSQYYITEIDPMELGIQMSHQVEPSEEEVLFSDDFNLNYFGYNPGSDIVA